MSAIFTLLLAQLCIIYLPSTVALFTAILNSFGTVVESFIHPMRSTVLSAIIQNISRSSNAHISIVLPKLPAAQKSSCPKHRIRRAKKECGVILSISEVPMTGPGCSVM